MAFNISSLSSYVANIDPVLFSKSVAGARTAADLIAVGSVVFGKGRVAVRTMNLDANFQSGDDSCARNASGDITLGNIHMDIVRLKQEKNLCFQDLENTYYALLVNGSIQPSEEGPNADFANSIVDAAVTKQAEVNERGLWISSTGLTASFGSDYTNFNKYNGITTQLGASASVIALTASGSTMVEKLQNAVLTMPIKISSASDFRLAVGQDTYNSYLVALAGKNIYKPTDDQTVFGTSARMWVVPGLNGTGEIVGIRLSNLRLGMASQADLDRIELEYLKDSTFHGWTMDNYFSIGIIVIDASEAGLGASGY
jgi:hypothetical protein